MTSSGTTQGIGDHGLLSNCHGAALVTRGGTIDWACLPRFDSPSIFAGLLDADAGHWSLHPTDPSATATRRYLDDTMVLATTWRTASGEVEVWDLLPLGPEERGHHIGHDARPSIVRVVHGRRGTTELETEIALRPEFGLVTPRHHPRNGGLLVRGGASAFAISSAIELGVEGASARTTFTVEAGERVAFEVHLCSPWSHPPEVVALEELLARTDDTVAAWRSWSTLHQSYDGPYRDLVSLSGRVLQALTYAPSGAIVAAPTTSLPESLGGSRNWDYRYSWVRDASLTLEALWVAACPDEAEDFFGFFATLPPTAGPPPTRASGRCAATPGTSPTRSSCAG